jgi:hypothetical protein
MQGHAEMGFLTAPPPTLRPGEQIRWSDPMACTYKTGYIGGRLYLSDGGHVILPTGGHRISPLAAASSPHGRPFFSPSILS